MTNKPTYFLYGNSFFRNSSNIDLTFSSNIGFTRYYGIKPSVFEEYHHNITYGTPDFNVHPLPPYYRQMWDYQNASTENVQKVISSLIPHETKLFDCKIPEWMNIFIISVLKEISIFSKRYYRNHFEYNKETSWNQASVRNLLWK